jgi:hypothetical protein
MFHTRNQAQKKPKTFAMNHRIKLYLKVPDKPLKVFPGGVMRRKQSRAFPDWLYKCNSRSQPNS